MVVTICYYDYIVYVDDYRMLFIQVIPYITE